MSWHVESLNVADINKTDLQLHRRAAVSAGIFQGNLPTLEFLLQVKKIHSLIVCLHSFLIMAQSCIPFQLWLFLFDQDGKVTVAMPERARES